MEPTFGERLSRWMQFLGVRGAELARRVGLSRVAIHGWMTDATAPTTDRLPAIVTALGITQTEFFGRLPELTPLAHPPAPPNEFDDRPVTRELTAEQLIAALDRSDACPTCGHKTGEAA